VANHKKTKKPRKPRQPLPKVGTPANNRYRLEHSRRDVVDFGRGGNSRWMGILVIVVLVLVALGFVGWIVLT